MGKPIVAASPAGNVTSGCPLANIWRPLPRSLVVGEPRADLNDAVLLVEIASQSPGRASTDPLNATSAYSLAGQGTEPEDVSRAPGTEDLPSPLFRYTPTLRLPTPDAEVADGCGDNQGDTADGSALDDPHEEAGVGRHCHEVGADHAGVDRVREPPRGRAGGASLSPSRPAKHTDDAYTAAEDSDAVVLLQPHSEYDLDCLVQSSVLLDTRGTFEGSAIVHKCDGQKTGSHKRSSNDLRRRTSRRRSFVEPHDPCARGSSGLT